MTEHTPADDEAGNTVGVGFVAAAAYVTAADDGDPVAVRAVLVELDTELVQKPKGWSELVPLTMGQPFGQERYCRVLASAFEDGDVFAWGYLR